MDIPDEIQNLVKKIQLMTNLELPNTKILISVAIYRMFVECNGTRKDNFIAEVVADTHELQKKNLLGKQIRKMPKESDK